MGAVTWALATTLSVSAAVQVDPPEDRLYGRVTTAAGDVFEGFLRWDRNEGSWGDVLDGSKEIPWENYREAERLDEEYGIQRARERSLSLLGVRISWEEDEDPAETAISGIRFGHVRLLRVTGRDRARLTLRSGAELDLVGGSSDLGRGYRGLVVEDEERGTTELRWRDLEEVEFMQAPRGAAPSAERRLHGTVRTSQGYELTGYVAWDADEIFESDVLDGEERGRSVEIEFGRIAAIERLGRRSALVTLKDGQEVELRGTNDVNASNRGIAVSDPGLGNVIVGWRDFEGVRFHPPERALHELGSFDGGRRLRGTVTRGDGSEVSGLIRWDNDEEYTWEILDGRDGRVDLNVELGLVESIVRRGSWGVEVTLRDGRTFVLEGSNDVDEGNKGLFVTPDGEDTVLVKWWDVDRVTLEGR